MKNRSVNERKQEIFSIARNMVMEDGLSKLTIRGLAEKGNISIGSIYNLFGTKEKLILGIMEDYWEKVLGELKILCSEADGDFLVRLDGCYRYLKKTSDEFHKDWMKDFAELNITNTKIHPLINIYREEVRYILEDMLLEDPEVCQHFDEEFNVEEFSDLLLSLILLRLSDGEEDLGFVASCLRKTFDLK